MTDSATTIDVGPAPRGRPKSLEDELETVVGHTVSGLQQRYVATNQPPSVIADLARLRRAVTSDPGSDPSVWEYTIGALPASLVTRRRDAEPTSWERAAHQAVTLYAVHQQSMTKPAHKIRESVGAAVAEYERRAERKGALRQRFHSLGSAQTEAMRVYHLRGLITLLRSREVPLDYGLLARHLHALGGTRERSDRVLLQWGRDYHRIPPAESAPSALVPPTDAVTTE